MNKMITFAADLQIIMQFHSTNGKPKNVKWQT